MTTRTSNPCAAASSIPRSVAASPAASPSKQSHALVRQPRELLQLPLGERRAHRRDDRLEPGLAQREHVGVALDDDRALLLRDRGARAVEPVEQVALAEELALGRVDVLRAQRVVLAQLARLEAAHPPARVGQREEQAPVEVVVAAPVDEPGRGELLRA